MRHLGLFLGRLQQILDLPLVSLLFHFDQAVLMVDLIEHVQSILKVLVL